MQITRCMNGGEEHTQESTKQEGNHQPAGSVHKQDFQAILSTYPFTFPNLQSL